MLQPSRPGAVGPPASPTSTASTASPGRPAERAGVSDAGARAGATPGRESPPPTAGPGEDALSRVASPDITAETGTTTVAATAAPGGQIDAAAVRAVWSELLSIVRRRRRATEALLTNATALSVDGGVLRLGTGSTP
ncbi:MAG: hypothetical protein WKF47_02875 [Geodermatophilaceae bacterium]